jgi:ubiquinone/menaquinone biosynthesis C-methylase UbiE
MSQLPYFDYLLERFQGVPVLREVFGEHVHWGLFDSGCQETVSKAAYERAAVALSQRLVSMADIEPGQTILDAGCGFGGTARLIAQQVRGARVIGVNVDARQVEEARRLKSAQNVRYLVADACKLPVASASVDRVLAVESVFHFPSRLRFLREARRVLRPGGRIVLSDFLLHGPALPSAILRVLRHGNPMTAFYGRVSSTTRTGYYLLSQLAGLRVKRLEDVTQATRPTYRFLHQLAADLGQQGTAADRANRFMESLTDHGELRYALIELRAR